MKITKFSEIKGHDSVALIARLDNGGYVRLNLSWTRVSVTGKAAGPAYEFLHGLIAEAIDTNIKENKPPMELFYLAKELWSKADLSQFAAAV